MEMPLRGNGTIGEAKNDAGQVARDHDPERMDLRMIATMVLAHLDSSRPFPAENGQQNEGTAFS